MNIEREKNTKELDAEIEVLAAGNKQLADLQRQLDASQAMVNELREVMEMIHNAGGLGPYKHSCINAVLAKAPEQSLSHIEARVANDVVSDALLILKGIDETETDSEDGWWETSTGAAFGDSLLKEIKAISSKYPKEGE